MEHIGKIVNREENQARMTYLLQVETALRYAQQDKKILENTIHDLVLEVCRLRTEIAQLKMRVA